MSSAEISIYLAGWFAGIAVFLWGVRRDWNNPQRRRDLAFLKGAIQDPRGMTAVAIVAFMFWWALLIAVPWDAYQDRSWTAEEGDDDA